jgi:hypothetical protein
MTHAALQTRPLMLASPHSGSEYNTEDSQADYLPCLRLRGPLHAPLDKGQEKHESQADDGLHRNEF